MECQEGAGCNGIYLAGAALPGISICFDCVRGYEEGGTVMKSGYQWLGACLMFAAMAGIANAQGLAGPSVGQPATQPAGQSAAAQYLPPFRPLAHGMAPGMKVQLLGEDAGQKTYAVIFSTGDEVLAGLTEFAETYHLAASRITGIGAISSATLGWLDLQKKMYRKITVDGQVEVLSMLGDIALYNGKPVIHAHMVVGYPDGAAHGGHLIEAHVRPTLEVIVTEYPKAMHKQADPDSGMALIHPETEDKKTK